MRQDRGGRTEYRLYQYDGSPALKQVDGPWSSEAEALQNSLQKWGLSRRLLKFSGGSGDMLRDVLY